MIKNNKMMNCFNTYKKSLNNNNIKIINHHKINKVKTINKKLKIIILLKTSKNYTIYIIKTQKTKIN